mmetsp:Transcript_11724/g.22285  ORF Transcript_11724/g.22285 Transcript_11724/m.22285 type:complete len:216 (+) Transcript_11724:1299-1946(+)
MEHHPGASPRSLLCSVGLHDARTPRRARRAPAPAAPCPDRPCYGGSRAAPGERSGGGAARAAGRRLPGRGRLQHAGGSDCGLGACAGRCARHLPPECVLSGSPAGGAGRHATPAAAAAAHASRHDCARAVRSVGLQHGRPRRCCWQLFRINPGPVGVVGCHALLRAYGAADPPGSRALAGVAVQRGQQGERLRRRGAAGAGGRRNRGCVCSGSSP